jgi:hypothetical protein
MEVPGVELIMQAAGEEYANEITRKHGVDDVVCRNGSFATPSSSKNTEQAAFLFATPFKSKEGKQDNGVAGK